MKNILVTGGAGYVGTVLSKALVEDGYYVRVLDNFMFGDHLNGIVNLEKIKGDIRDKEVIHNSLKDIDYVIHLAAISNDPCSELDHKITKQINYDASKYLIDKSKEMGVTRFIYASSSSVYGIKKESEVTEDLNLEPITLYSELKGKVEEYLFTKDTDEFIVAAVRSATVCGYSPRMRLDTILNIFINCAYNEGEIFIEGGDQKRPLIHIKDIVRFYSELLEYDSSKINGEVFNVSYDNYKIKIVAELVKNLTGCKINYKDITDPRSYSLSTKKVKSTLKFQPNYTIEDAAKELLQCFKEGKIDRNDIRNYNIKLMKSNNFF